MRFGKTFAAYQLAKRMGFQKVLILTFKPAVVSAWREDLQTHLDFEGWQFISRDTDLTYEGRTSPGPSSVSAPSWISWGSTGRPAASSKKMSGYIPSTGIWSSSTSTTSAHGRRTQRNFSTRRTRTPTTAKIWTSTTGATPATRPGCPSPPIFTSTFPVRPSGRSIPGSLSRNRSTTGPTPTNSGPRPTGRGRTTPTSPSPGW